MDGTNTPDEYIGKEVSVYYDPWNPNNAWPILPEEKETPQVSSTHPFQEQDDQKGSEKQMMI